MKINVKPVSTKTTLSQTAVACNLVGAEKSSIAWLRTSNPAQTQAKTPEQ
jgi:hypothetical protein